MKVIEQGETNSDVITNDMVEPSDKKVSQTFESLQKLYPMCSESVFKVWEGHYSYRDVQFIVELSKHVKEIKPGELRILSAVSLTGIGDVASNAYAVTSVMDPTNETFLNDRYDYLHNECSAGEQATMLWIDCRQAIDYLWDVLMKNYEDYVHELATCLDGLITSESGEESDDDKSEDDN